MKNIILLLLFSLSYAPLTAQEEVPDEKKKKKAENKLEFIQYQYEEGAYEDAVTQARRFIRSFSDEKQLLPEVTFGRLLQARALNASFIFGESEKVFQEATAAISSSMEFSDEDLFASYLYLADYLQETGDLNSAESYLKKAFAFLTSESTDALIKNESTEKQKADFSLIKAKVLYQQGFLREAMQLLEQQTNYRLQAASASMVDIKDREALNEKLDYTKRKENYGTLLTLKASLLLAKGMYQEAETAIKNSQAWIADQLGKKHSLYREALVNEAELALIKNNPGKASSIYMDAYTSQGFPENEEQKILNLTQAIIAYIESGQIIKINNYLRRLQMYAFRSIGPYDPFQIAFEYAQSYKSFYEGNFSSSMSRLEKISENFKFLPASHYWNNSILELKAKVALKSGNVKAYKECLSLISASKEKFAGVNSPAFHKTRLRLAMYEINFGKDLSLAEDIMQKSYQQVVKKEIETTSRENILYLSAYAELYGKKDRYDSASVKANEAAEVTKLIYGEKSAEYASAFARFTEYQILSGKYKEGFENLQKATTLAESVREGDTEIRQNAFVILSRMYALIGEFEKSQTLLTQAYRLSFSGYEKQMLAEAETAEQLGSLYLLSGNYYRAEKSLKTSLSLKEATLSSDNPLLIHIYQELARLSLITGDYNNADHYLKKAMLITEGSFDKNSLRFAECLLISADYYLSIGDYKKAEEACIKADDITIDKLGKNNLRRAEILSELAFIRFKAGSYKSNDIEKLYKEADNIIRNSLGASNPLSAILSQKQAELFISTGKAEKAEPLLNEAEKYWASKLGTDNRYSAEIQLLRGDIAYAAGKYDPAEKNYKKSQQQYEHIFSNKHPGYTKSSGKLARVYYMKKDIQKSLETMEEIIPKYLDYTVKNFPSLSFSEKSKFWNNMKEEFEFYNFIAFSMYGKNPKLSEKVYNNIISTKALLLTSDLRIRESIMSSQDSLLIDYYNQLIAEKEYLTTVLSLTKQQLIEQKIDPGSIEDDIEFLEKEIGKRSEIFSGEEKKKRATWLDIKNTLRENEYAIEIVRFRNFNKTFTDSVLYAALIVHNKSESPEVVKIENGSQIEKKQLKIYRNSIIYKLKDRNSYTAFWEPIDAKIPEGATIYVSGDGAYNQLNIETLSDPEDKFVLEKNQVVLVTNTKDLLNKQREIPLGKKDHPKENKKAEVEYKYMLCGNPTFYTEQKSGHLVPLPGAEQEVNEINKVLTANGKTTLKFLNEHVTEDTLKKLESPAVFHIATHGYFKEAVNTGQEDFASDPLLNSGLLLYGSGDILSNTENQYVNHKEGILTAYEARNLPFDHTELVVLSACETGLGEVQVGEGVYGLQRAFLIAGADAVVMSLFKVNDEVTQKLMVSFYTKWLKSGNKRTAFIEAKREIKQEYNIPLYWGAFIMIEGKPQSFVLQDGVK